MGTFITPEYVKTKARVPELEAMDPEDLDEIYIIPAERLLENEFNLDINTDNNPRHWHARFQSSTDGARLKSEWEADFKRAVFWVIESIAANPEELRMRTVGGSTWFHRGGVIPRAAHGVMRRWMQAHRLGRA